MKKSLLIITIIMIATFVAVNEYPLEADMLCVVGKGIGFRKLNFAPLLIVVVVADIAVVIG